MDQFGPIQDWSSYIKLMDAKHKNDIKNENFQKKRMQVDYREQLNQ